METARSTHFTNWNFSMFRVTQYPNGFGTNAEASNSGYIILFAVFLIRANLSLVRTHFLMGAFLCNGVGDHLKLISAR
jgi:hypothetical protein